MFYSLSAQHATARQKSAQKEETGMLWLRWCLQIAKVSNIRNKRWGYTSCTTTSPWSRSLAVATTLQHGSSIPPEDQHIPRTHSRSRAPAGRVATATRPCRNLHLMSVDRLRLGGLVNATTNTKSNTPKGDTDLHTILCMKDHKGNPLQKDPRRARLSPPPRRQQHKGQRHEDRIRHKESSSDQNYRWPMPGHQNTRG